MRTTIKKIVEFIKFVVGSMFITIGVFVGETAGFIAKICWRMVDLGITMASDLRSRYMLKDEFVFINNRKMIDVVQEESST